MLEETSYTPEEVAQILKISRYTVYELVKRGELAAYRIGRKIRVESSDLNAYIEKSKDKESSIQNAENLFEGEIQIKNGVKYVKIGNVELQVITDYEDKVKVLIRPEDIILTKSTFKSSARNFLKGKVQEIISEGPLVQIKLDAAIPLIAFITKQSLEDMKIVCGEEIYAVFKSTAIRILK